MNRPAESLLEDARRDAALPRGYYDLVFARWVMLFLPDPAAHMRKLVRALKPGGLLALEDYHRERFALVPRPPEWADLLAAERAFLATQGGDVSVGGRLRSCPDASRRLAELGRSAAHRRHGDGQVGSEPNGRAVAH